MHNNLTTKSDIQWNSHSEKLGGITLIAHLFNRLNDLYLGKFTASFKTPEEFERAMDTWAEMLTDKKITLAEIKKALSDCVEKHAWPPTFPEFLALCRKPIDYQLSYIEAINQLRERKTGNDKWSNPAIYWAAVEIGYHDLMCNAWSTLKSRWTATLDKHLADNDIKDVPEALNALPSADKIHTPREVAAKNIEALKNAIKGAINKVNEA